MTDTDAVARVLAAGRQLLASMKDVPVQVDGNVLGACLNELCDALASNAAALAAREQDVADLRASNETWQEQYNHECQLAQDMLGVLRGEITPDVLWGRPHDARADSAIRAMRELAAVKRASFDHADALVEERTRNLRAQLAAAREDAARLDALREQFRRSGVNIRSDIMRYSVTVTQELTMLQIESARGDVIGAAFNASIDAARAAQPWEEG